MKRMIIGTTLIMLLALNGCASKSQAETIPSTIAATTEAKTTEETTTTEAKTIPEETATLEEITKLNLPTLSTGRQFTEEEAMAYEAVYGNWEAQSNENKVVLGRDSLITLVQSALLDFTEQEVSEVTDFILTQLPIPEVIEAQPSESKQAPEESLPGDTKPSQEDTKPVQSKPAPQVETTQSKPVINEPVQQPEVNNNTNTDTTGKPADVSEQEWQEWLEFEESIKGGTGKVNEIEIQPGEAGYDDSGEINIGGY